jgi:hypothetical protein
VYFQGYINAFKHYYVVINVYTHLYALFFGDTIIKLLEHFKMNYLGQMENGSFM